MPDITLRTEYITLGQALKLAGVVQTGGEAKMLLAEAEVRVNGEPDNRRGRKLYSGDVVKIKGVAPIRVFGPPPENTVATAS